MCVVSNIGDQYGRTLPNQFPWINNPPKDWTTQTYVYTPGPTRAEFDELKKVVEQMRLDLIAAKAQDIAEGNPDCEMEEKVALLKRVADLVGVDLSEVFG